MNDVQRLIDRQLGFKFRLEYDSALRRLAVHGDESYYGLAMVEGSRVPDLGDQDPPIFACRFAETAGYEHILALANEDGRVAIQDTSKIGHSSLDGFQCHNNAVFDLAWRPHHMHFVTVSGDHTACLWDIAESVPKRVLLLSHHTRSVKTAVFQPAASVVATGARDGHVLVWDVRTGGQPAVVMKPDNALLNCHASFTPKTPGSHGKRPRLDTPRAASVTGLVFQDDLTLLSCGECDGNIKVWDLRKNYNIYKREPLPKHSIPYCGSSTRNGYTNLIVDAARVRLYASCMDSVIYCFNISTYSPSPEQRYTGHENGTFYIKTCLSPDGRYLVSGSSDKSAYIWSVRRARPVVRLTGHRAEVTAAAWGRGYGGPLATCSDDARHRLWRVGPERDCPGPGPEPWGRAEPLPAEPPPGAPLPGGGWTPRQPKRRRAEIIPERPLPAPRRTKRCLVSLLTAAGDALAKRPKPSGEVPPPAGTKRGPAEDPADPKRRRLAPPQPLLPAGIKRKSTGDEASPRKQQCTRLDASPEPGPSQCHTTPPKQYEKKGCKMRSPRSPRPKVSSPNKASSIVSTVSPNESLAAARALWPPAWPDYVRTGEAPHHRLMSPHKPRSTAPDWLTLLRRQRAANTDHSGPQPRAVGNSSPQPRVAGNSSPQPRVTGNSSPQPRITGNSSPQPRAGGNSSPQPRASGNSNVYPNTPSLAALNSPPARRPSTSDKTTKVKTKTLLKYFSIAEKD